MALSTLRLGGYALIGVAMAAVILLPVLAAFFGDNRLASDYPLQLLYDYSYYEGLLRGLSDQLRLRQLDLPLLYPGG